MTNISGPGGGGTPLPIPGDKEAISTNTGQGQGVEKVTTKSVNSSTAVDTVQSGLQGSEGTSTGLGSAPPLPDVAGTSSPDGASWRVGWMAETGTGALMWAALNEMARTSMRDMKSAKEAKRAFQDGAVDSKKNRVKSTEQKQAAERDEAARNFRDSCITAVIVCAISIAGAKVGAGAEKGSEAANKSAAIIGAANSIGQVYSSYGNMQSKTDGPQREADEKELEAMRWEMEAEMMDQMVEEAQSSYEESKELFQLGLRILAEHYELASQATQTYTRG